MGPLLQKFFFSELTVISLGYYNVTKQSTKKPKVSESEKYEDNKITLRCYIFRCYVYVADTYLLFLIFLLLN